MNNDLETKDTQHPCALCRDYFSDDDPIPSGSLVVGQKWSDYHERYIVFRGYLCDQHLQDCMKPGYRFLEVAK